MSRQLRGVTEATVPSRDFWSVMPHPPPVQTPTSTPRTPLSVPTQSTPRSTFTTAAAHCGGCSRASCRRYDGTRSRLPQGHPPAAPSYQQIMPSCVQDVAAAVSKMVTLAAAATVWGMSKMGRCDIEVRAFRPTNVFCSPSCSVGAAAPDALCGSVGRHR